MNVRLALETINITAVSVLERYEDARKELTRSESELAGAYKHVIALERELDKLYNAYGDDNTGLWADMISDLENDLNDMDDEINELEGEVQDAEDTISSIEMDVEAALHDMKDANGNY
jgi:predicted  nucleic acid-binding Zn-ribbon protein